MARIKGNSPGAQGRRAAVEDDIEDAEKKGDKKEVAKLKEGRMKELHGYNLQRVNLLKILQRKWELMLKLLQALMAG